jgi:leucyl-tRNA synthetase
LAPDFHLGLYTLSFGELIAFYGTVATMAGYNPSATEKKWRQVWLQKKIFATQSDASRPKFYVLDMFPYPSGDGLHVGHTEGYTATDIVARYKRARGFNVMHPMGWDAFGLPAEQYAIKTNQHPGVITQRNIDRFRAQLQAVGLSYDWDREVNTTDPNYYRWTQWIFLLLYDTWFDEILQKGRPIAELIGEYESGKRSVLRKRWNELSPAQQREKVDEARLAYIEEALVNWCPALGTVLANEEVIDGKSEVGGFPVERRLVRQWMLRITVYAQRLLDGLEKLNWTDSLKMMQRNWIGRSEGAKVDFAIKGRNEKLTVFTTRPDTLFGATYMVMAPEHPLVDLSRPGHIVPKQWPAGTNEKWKNHLDEQPGSTVAKYQGFTRSRSERQRQESTSKTGVFTGLYATNPVNGEDIPIFISDYVLMGYGTGAIMAVPAHDARDFDFAKKFELPIQRVVSESQTDPDAGELPLEAQGWAVNSPGINGLPTAQARSQMCELLEAKDWGWRQINYKIRDWLFSRQRYWGEPFPLVHLEDGTVVALAESELPLKLPEMEDFKPTGTIAPPLTKARDWMRVHVILEGPKNNQRARVIPEKTKESKEALRETNTMPQWAGSCWYYLRFLDPHNKNAFCDKQIEKYWMTGDAGPGVDLYVGGVEHAVLHLLYSRFWHKVLFDRGYVSTDEPFRQLVNQGTILGEAEYTVFHTESGSAVSIELVDAEWGARTGPDGKMQITSKHKQTGELLIGTACNPDEVEKRGEVFVLKANPQISIDVQSSKMSKSRGNVVNPDDVIATYGADALRLFEMFLGPLEQMKPWSTAGVEGVYRFLQRVWRNLLGAQDGSLRVVHTKNGMWWCGARELSPDETQIAQRDAAENLRLMHRTIRKVTQDIDRFSFNTAISSMMEFNNALGRLTWVPEEAALNLVRLLEPFAPHFAEEMYHILTGEDEGKSVSQVPWPAYDESLCVDEEVEIPVQINGKLTGRVKVPSGAGEEQVIQAALADEQVKTRLDGRVVKKKIYIKDRMVNLVV